MSIVLVSQHVVAHVDNENEVNPPKYKQLCIANLLKKQKISHLDLNDTIHKLYKRCSSFLKFKQFI